MMRRKFFATVLALVLSVATMVGCGSSADSAADMGGDTGPAAYADGTAEVVDESPAEIAEPNDASQGLADVAGENDDFGRPPEEDLVPWDVEAGEEDVTEEVPVTGEIEGIIVLQADWRDQSVLSYTVFAVNPNTGDSCELSQFQFTNVNQYNAEFTIQPAWRFGHYANLYDHFSNDYTKIAATKAISSSGEVHAGWLDTSGNFYDVTEALGEQAQSDFDAPASYYAVGFQEDMFIYVRSDDEQDDQYHGVSLDDITPGASWEIDDADKLIGVDRDTWYWLVGYRPTDWLDDDRVLVETMQSKCRIATISSQTLEEYLPGESTHHNWSAVASPDGTQVAFISRPDAGNEINMYIASISGDNPVRLEPDFMPVFHPTAANIVSSGMACCYILEWR